MAMVTVRMGVITGVITAVPGVIPHEFEKITMPPMTTKKTMANTVIVTSFGFFGGKAGVIGKGDADGVASVGTGSPEGGCTGGSACGALAGGTTSMVSTIGGGAG